MGVSLLRIASAAKCFGRIFDTVRVAQLVERPPCKRGVIGSSPIVGTNRAP